MKGMYKLYSTIVCLSMTVLITYSIVDYVKEINKEVCCSNYLAAKLKISKDYRYE